MADTNYSVQGCVPVRRLRNNDSLSISIESTQPLFQGVDANNDNATPFPNWETDDAARLSLLLWLRVRKVISYISATIIGSMVILCLCLAEVRAVRFSLQEMVSSVWMQTEG